MPRRRADPGRDRPQLRRLLSVPGRFTPARSARLANWAVNTAHSFLYNEPRRPHVLDERGGRGRIAKGTPSTRDGHLCWRMVPASGDLTMVSGSAALVHRSASSTMRVPSSPGSELQVVDDGDRVICRVRVRGRALRHQPFGPRSRDMVLAREGQCFERADRAVRFLPAPDEARATLRKSAGSRVPIRASYGRVLRSR